MVIFLNYNRFDLIFGFSMYYMEILVPPADFGQKINIIACYLPVLPENCVTVNHMTRSVPAVAPTAKTLLTMHNFKKT